ncbi:LacI family DNA-binding transcriptional regulator [Microbacterium invictum]|uniref:DNA-binding LacI/PurR family transcriptional regulator n=2 Tax=Microbacterium invictum TaxID=515415 RepID=A0AA40SSM9_9MICO|nr:substrate-binding domain-containing protein [Microbacterium invictum]MBB4141450.1 DNA-binding LacI/PurR family transcriptional regulator [Microbacterium invictum]
MTTHANATGRRVGMRDVAALAGVSTQTVSRVINDHPNIRPATRARVLEAMASIGYRINNAARALGTATTRTLGVIASDAALYGPSAGIVALDGAARAADRWIATAYADAADADSVTTAVERLLTQGIDGIIVLAPHARTLELVRAAVPHVPVAALHSALGAQRQSEGAALAVDHLVSLGHRRIARLSGPADWLEASARDRGVDEALARHGLDAGVCWEGDWRTVTGAQLAPDVAAAVRASGGPTAIVVANDQMALGLIAGLDAAGIDVPSALSVTGFDDNPDAAYYRPALTTVRLDLVGEAHRAVAEALGLPQAADPASPRLVTRASTAAPA